ncbi:hypothetical protein [Bacillus cereus]|uniref:hypothetical protein n=1 Tax=Bacillus cereus TaxID=1396 RepID=UPI0015CF00B3|nr:hypothetical protein [Bacillus cereus]
MTTTQEKTNRPKHKQLRMRQKENPMFLEWLDNQTDFNDSIRKLIENHVMRHGTKDINDYNVVLGMAKDLVLLDQYQHGQVIPVATQKIEEVPQIQQEQTVKTIEKEEIKEVVEEKIEKEPEIEQEETSKNKRTGKKVENRNVGLNDF